MSANRKRFVKAIFERQDKYHRYEDQLINENLYNRRKLLIGCYFTENKARFAQHPKLKHPHHRQYLKDCMQAAYGRDMILISIDTETWEAGDALLEVGIAIFDPRGQQALGYPHIKTFHLINDEALHLRNGRFVPDRRYNFMGKMSWKMPFDLIVSFVQGILDYYFDIEGWEAVIVGHSVQHDIMVLKDMGVDVPDDWAIDTQKLFALNRTKTSQTNLRVALQDTHILGGYMHNGGNDAYFALQLLLKLADPEVRKVLNLDKFENTINPKRLFEEYTPAASFRSPIPYSALACAFPEPYYARIVPNTVESDDSEDSDDSDEDESDYDNSYF
ncbi:hypothetical protein JNB11_05475 [Kocuria palustris]|nr:hypothetical protein [Kocuria palustris]